MWEFGETAYEIIPGVMRLREDLRGYVMTLMDQLAATVISGSAAMYTLPCHIRKGCSCHATHGVRLCRRGMPPGGGSGVRREGMVRFRCNSCEQFMFGPDWLVAPVYIYNVCLCHRSSD